MRKTSNVIGRLLVFSLVVIIAMGGATSCKSKKKLAREKAEAEYKAKVDQAKKDLTAILNDETNWTLEQKKERVKTIKSYNLDDQEVKDLLVKVDEKLKQEERQLEEERLKREEMEKAQRERQKYASITNAFAGIARAANYDEANSSIGNVITKPKGMRCRSGIPNLPAKSLTQVSTQGPSTHPTTSKIDSLSTKDSSNGLRRLPS